MAVTGTDLTKQVKTHSDKLAQLEGRSNRMLDLVDEVYQLKQAVAELQQKVVDILNKS